jgi:peptidyl-prolyl cis-trans isomerase D
MASGKKGGFSNAVVWVILVLLIIGLAGFGATSFGGSVTSIGKVGDREIGTQRYARALQTQINQFSQQFGQNLTLSQAQQFGIDRAVLGQLVSTAALENEAATLGISAGDEAVRKQILAISAFQGLDGNFDREAYRFTLQQSGLNEGQFEENLRAEIARTLLQGAVASAVETPAIYTETLGKFIGERRNFHWTALTVDDMQSPFMLPTEDDLQAYYEANSDDFMLPETRKITYAWLTPDMIVDTVDVDEDALRGLYELRIDDFVKPERRLVERLILGAGAEAAKARLDAGEITFEELVAERELALSDIDLGDVTEADLGAAGAAVFATEEPGVVGPAPTDLGAALFRVNAILNAQETSFEDARAELVDEFALDAARRAVDDQLENIDDLLAGGATLEDLAAETDMQLGTIDWSRDTSDGIAAYDAFRTAAAAAQQGDFPEVTSLEDGGLFALRLDEVIAPRLEPLDNARAQAETGWRSAQITSSLVAQAEALAAQLRDGADVEMLDITLEAAENITRESFIANTPADFLETVFAMESGDIRVLEGDTQAYLVRLDEILAPDPDNADLTLALDRLSTTTAQSIGSDILAAYTAAVEAKAGISINQVAINAVHAQFP